MNEENNLENTTNTTINTVNSECNFSNKKKINKNVIALLTAIILGLLIIIGVFYYFKVYTRADQFYKRALSYALDKLVEEKKYETSKTEIIMNTEVQKKGYNTATTQLKAEGTLLNMELYRDFENGKSYIYLKDFLDKYLDISDETEKDGIEVVINELKKELKEINFLDYCSNSKVEIDVNGETIKATKNTLSIENSEFINELINVVEKLSCNKKILKNMTTEEKDDLQSSADSFIKLLEDFKDTYANNYIYELHIYTKDLLMKDIVKIEFDLCSYFDERDRATLIGIEKKADKQWEYEIISDETFDIYGEFDLNEEDRGEIILTIELNDYAIVKYILNYNSEYNISLDKINSINSSKIDDLPQKELLTLINNFQNSTLYYIFSGIGEDFQNAINGNSNNGNSSDIGNEEWIDNGNNDILNNSNGILSNGSNDNILNNNSNNNDVVAKSREVEILTSLGSKVKLDIPQGYTLDSDYSSKYSAWLRKNSSTISISTTYDDVLGYQADLEATRDSYLNDEYYKNVKLNMESKTINGRQFYFALLEFEFASSGNKNMFIWTEISKDYILKMQLVGIDDITDAEINTILTSLEVK